MCLFSTCTITTAHEHIPIQSRTLRQKAARTAAQTNRRLDQPANPTATNPSLNSNTACLKVVDTFRLLGTALVLMLNIFLILQTLGVAIPGLSAS